MRRLAIAPRPDFQARLEAVGLSFHSWDDYWREDVCYAFSAAQIDHLEAVTLELHRMCIEAARFIVARERFADLGIPEPFWGPIAESLARDDFSLYGRFDLAYDGQSEPRLLEYNADTPTSLLESAVAQWYWLEDLRAGGQPHLDQFNSLHERLVEQWRRLGRQGVERVHFTSMADNEEDWVCTAYLADTALQAGLQAPHLYIGELGWSGASGDFVDLDNAPVAALFKLYPWEWLMREPFGCHIPGSATRFIEPLWKSLLACKGLLPILWELFPGHPNLLPAFFEADRGRLDSYARKPLYSREGANVALYEGGRLVGEDDGPYGQEGFIYQALHRLPRFGDRYPVIGAWVVGDEPAGICLREDVSPITTNMSNFVPHYFE